MIHSIRLLIVDDHPVVRAGLKGMLGSQPDFITVGEAADGLQAVQLTRERSPDVVLIDLKMPGMNGTDAIQRIREENDRVRFLVLTTYNSDEDILPAIQAGAAGYLLKDVPREELFQAVRAVAAGKSVLDPNIASRVLQHMRNPQPQSLLSEREIEILRLVARGFTNKAIGRQLHISEATVKTHLHHTFNKLNVPDRTSAVTAAVQRGIIRLGEA